MKISMKRGKPIPSGLSIALLLMVACTCCLSQGCNYFILASYLIGGPPSIEPDFDRVTHQSMTDKDVKVVVVAFAPHELQLRFHKVDKELEKYVAFKLANHHIKVAPPDLVRAWLDENPEWDKAEEIGEAFNATYVVYIDISDYSLYEPNSSMLYRGRADGMVSVFEMDEDGYGTKIYTKEIDSTFPTLQARQTTDVTYSTFKQQYMTRLSEQIGRLFYEYYNGDDIPDAI